MERSIQRRLSSNRKHFSELTARRCNFVDNAMTLLTQKMHEMHEWALAHRATRPVQSGQPFDWATVTWLDLSAATPADADVVRPNPDLYTGDQPPTYYRGKI